jgi:DNA-directed RNA polymerase subunit RPC12/RpoP
MTVRCGRCGTLYRRPAGARLAPGRPYRCTRCGYEFDAVEDDEPAVLGPDEPDEPPDEGVDEPVAGPRADPDDEPEPEDEPGDASQFAFDPDDAAPAQAAADREAAAREWRWKSPPRFALRAMLTMTLGYGVLSAYLYTHPEGVPDVIGRVPVLGTPLVERRLAPARIELINVRGEYQRVKGDRLVFLVRGTAVNGSPVPVRGIQVEGRIIGQEEQRQVVFCGAAPRDVRDLSLREIALLQTLEPPKDWRLAPGEKTDFLVAFTGPPPDLREFAAEVVAVRAPAPRRDPLPAQAPAPGGP